MSDIPQQFKDLALSSELYDQSEKIGNKFGLHIDQIGELDAEIRDVLDGFAKSADFINDLIRRLEINRGLAQEIATEVNKAVFDTLKTKLVPEEAGQSSDIEALERVGGFSVEQEHAEADAGVSTMNRGDTLESIEDPQPSKEEHVKKHINLLDDDASHVDPIIDHMLKAPTSQPEMKIDQSAPVHYGDVPANLPIVEETPAPAVAPEAKAPPKGEPKRTGPDSYREKIE